MSECILKNTIGIMFCNSNVQWKQIIFALLIFLFFDISFLFWIKYNWLLCWVENNLQIIDVLEKSVLYRDKYFCLISSGMFWSFIAGTLSRGTSNIFPPYYEMTLLFSWSSFLKSWPTLWFLHNFFLSAFERVDEYIHHKV